MEEKQRLSVVESVQRKLEAMEAEIPLYLSAENMAEGWEEPVSYTHLDVYKRQPHDRQEITSNDGVLSINWEDVLAVFSAKVTGCLLYTSRCV